MKIVDIKDILFTISTWEGKDNLAHLEKIQEALNRSKKPKVVT